MGDVDTYHTDLKLETVHRQEYTLNQHTLREKPMPTSNGCLKRVCIHKFMRRNDEARHLVASVLLLTCAGKVCMSAVAPYTHAIGFV